ncbi:hypothetical protein J2Z40_002227 [Cytobacillus eiseniae]|uniref:Uncharacterized protein n=1 Tax=Cytobacillus eiseniae TaxID=762947 RepID=A0ABS4RFH7_9BACI|nr:hypothetical protein [Cytobacillus eiseniae]MBP2241655.1 hypothetical protein [Cytobacillus eiseniae]
MDENRKTIIVNEITSWKKNRMLPEQYCDYLLALYTEGNQQEEVGGKRKRDRFWKNHFLFILFIPLTLVLIHFTELSITLQITFSILFILIGVIFTIYFCRKGILLQIPFIVSAFILLFSSVEFISRIFPDQSSLLYATLIANCLIWILSGWKLKIQALLISGVLGITMLIIYIFI